MFNKNVNEITEEDLQLLISNEVMEGKTIEYKKEIHYSNDKEKKEFLADVSSFANAVGGNLIFGIEEDRDTGLPKEICGVDINNIDEEIRRIECIIRDGIEPKIPKFEIGTVKLQNSKIVLIINIQKSWLSPHRVVFKGWDKFFSRNTNRKYSLDVNELRTAFNLSSTISDKIKSFVQERISKLNLNETPVPYEYDTKLILQLIPFESFASNNLLHVNELKEVARYLQPMYSGGWDYKINFDGYIIYNGNQGNLSSSFIQCYRNGVVEFVNSSMLISCFNKEKIIPSVAYEQEIIKTVKSGLMYLQNINVQCPIFLFLSFVNIKNYKMAIDPIRNFFVDSYNIDRDILLAPETIIDNYDIDIKKILKPTLDSIWNACGISQSLNYDGNNNFKY